MFNGVFHFQKLFMFSVLLDSEEGSLWDLWALDWMQQKAECMRFCIGRSVTPAGQLPVSTDIEYEFGSRNPYNFLQVTYYKVSYSSGSHERLYDIIIVNLSSLLIDLHIALLSVYDELHSLSSSSCTTVGKAAEGGICSSYLLCGQPQSPGDEEQHWEVQTDGRSDWGGLPGQRDWEWETLGEKGGLMSL